MADPSKHDQKPEDQLPGSEAGHQGGKQEGRPVQQPTEAQPGEDWGERIGTGKVIDRGGKSSGQVPGATEQQP